MRSQKHIAMATPDLFHLPYFVSPVLLSAGHDNLKDSPLHEYILEERLRNGVWFPVRLTTERSGVQTLNNGIAILISYICIN